MDVRAGALSALSWWRDAGVDVIVDEAPRDWLRPAPSRPAPLPAPDPAPDPLPATLAALEQRLATPGLVPDALSGAVSPAGNIASGLMLLADMPEAGDAAAGQLVSGEAGRLLDAMLGVIGRDRASIYLAALAPARPASGRLAAETCEALGELAKQHIALAAPRMVLLLGEAAPRAILGLSLAEARGRIHDLNHRGATVGVVATFHPRYLLRDQGAKPKAWQDLRLLLGGLAQ